MGDLNNTGSLLVFIVLIVIGICINFMPAYIAIKRKHTHAGLIILINLFASWTGIGWIISLIWALSDKSSNVVDEHSKNENLRTVREKKVRGEY